MGVGGFGGFEHSGRCYYLSDFGSAHLYCLLFLRCIPGDDYDTLTLFCSVAVEQLVTLKLASTFSIHFLLDTVFKHLTSIVVQ